MMREYSPADVELMFEEHSEWTAQVFVWVVGEMRPAVICEYFNGYFACCWEYDGKKSHRPFLMWADDGRFVQGGAVVRVYSREMPPNLEFEAAVAHCIALMQDAGFWPEEDDQEEK